MLNRTDSNPGYGTKSSIREPRVVSRIKILGALDKRGSQLSNTLRINSISQFLACISSFEIMPFSAISTFLAETLSKSVRKLQDFNRRYAREKAQYGFPTEDFVFKSVSDGRTNFQKKLRGLGATFPE